ncbi:MAG TPA: hypothetical protein VMS08_00155 [Candidatus Saccharimonadia bacterium]|nr:hypothetical protein [Candidatus Saccharimonadia bacterium]
MDDQSQPAPHTIDDLTKADARAFTAAYGLQPDNSEHKAGESSKISPSKDDLVSQAVKQAEVVRTAYDKPQPVAIYIAVAAFLALVVTLSLVLSPKPQNTASSSNSSGGILTIPTPNSSATSGLSNQAQQDIKTCSNVVNAALEC